MHPGAGFRKTVVGALAVCSLLLAGSAFAADGIKGQVLGGRRSYRPINRDPHASECRRTQATRADKNRQ